MTCPVVLHGPEQGPVDIDPMAGERKIVLDHAQGGGINRDKANLGALALDARMHDARTPPKRTPLHAGQRQGGRPG
jgi:hypothetical protein